MMHKIWRFGRPPPQVRTLTKLLLILKLSYKLIETLI